MPRTTPSRIPGGSKALVMVMLSVTATASLGFVMPCGNLAKLPR
jgi:hypothetical protein